MRDLQLSITSTWPLPIVCPCSLLHLQLECQLTFQRAEMKLGRAFLHLHMPVSRTNNASQHRQISRLSEDCGRARRNPGSVAAVHENDSRQWTPSSCTLNIPRIKFSLATWVQSHDLSHSLPRCIYIRHEQAHREVKTHS